jgi:predicted DNA-binding transcriptional regulator AlpA
MGSGDTDHYTDTWKGDGKKRSSLRGEGTHSDNMKFCRTLPPVVSAEKKIEDAEGLAARKIYCEIVAGLTYEDRCLWKRAMTIDGNKSCENCILREVERLKEWEPQRKETRGRKRGTTRKKKTQGTEATVAQVSPVLNIRELSGLVGKAKRTLQKMAQDGRIPGKRTLNGWEFSRAKIKEWLSREKERENIGADPNHMEGQSRAEGRAIQEESDETKES